MDTKYIATRRDLHDIAKNGFSAQTATQCVSYDNCVDAIYSPPSAQLRKLTNTPVGPELNQIIREEPATVIYGLSQSSTDLSDKDVQCAIVHFSSDYLHDEARLTQFANSQMDYSPLEREAAMRHTELQQLCRAIEMTSEECRSSIDLTDPKTQQMLRDIYTCQGALRPHTPDLVNTSLLYVMQQMVDRLPLEYTLSMKEFQHNFYKLHYQSEHINRNSTHQYHIARALRDALQELNNNVTQKYPELSSVAKSNFSAILDEANKAVQNSNTHYYPEQEAFLVEQRNETDFINQPPHSIYQSMPAFDTIEKAKAYVMQAAQQNPHGYFMVYKAIAPYPSRALTFNQVQAIVDTKVYLPHDHLTPLMPVWHTPVEATKVQAYRTDMWNRVNEFAFINGLNCDALNDMPGQDINKIREAFEPGGILRPDTEQTHSALLRHLGVHIADTPEYQAVKDIQKILCTQQPTFYSVVAAVKAEANFVIEMRRYDAANPHAINQRQQALSAALSVAIHECKDNLPQRQLLLEAHKALQEGQDVVGMLHEQAQNFPDSLDTQSIDD